MGQMKSSASVAAQLATQQLISKVAVIVRARRGESLTGVHQAPELATACLLKASIDDYGYLKTTKHKQVSLIADRMVEPDPNITPISMLQHLPQSEAIFYSCEDNVIDTKGKCKELAWELESRFCFVGGSETEYVKYLSSSKSQPLWQWSKASQVRAYSGVSTVVKKDNFTQRKLMMQCVANYWFCDIKKRSELGMGVALR